MGQVMRTVNCRNLADSARGGAPDRSQVVPSRRFPVRISSFLAIISVLAAVGVTGAVRSGADPGQPGPPPPPPARPGVVQPNDAPRVAPIGGARVASSAPQGEGPGNGAPLAAARERSVAVLPPIATDGIHVATTWPGKSIVIHLPNERELTAANWGEGGAAAYGSGPVDYVVIPDAGGGVDIRMVRKSFISPTDFSLGVRVPDGTHLRQAGQAVVIETDARPGAPAAIIGALSVPEARDSAGRGIAVTPSMGGSYMHQQSTVDLNVGRVDLLAFPVTITVSYRATTTVPPIAATAAVPPDVPTAGDQVQPLTIPTGYVVDPAGAHRPASVDPAVWAQRHASACVSGPNTYSGGGVAADFWPACARMAMCMDATPNHTTPTVCANSFLGDLTRQCVVKFGADGTDYDACLAVANGHTRWVKDNMLPGPGH